MYKKTTFLFLFFILLTRLSFADTICSYEYFDQGHSTDEHILRSGYSAPANIELDAGFNLFIKGGLLYWSAYESGLELGYTSKASEINIYKLNNQYHLGAKGTIGAHLPHDNWDLNFTYLFYRTKQSSPKIENTVFDNFWYKSPLTDIEKMDSVSASWKLKINMMDTYLSRPFYLGTKLTFEPFFGFRGGWINQKYNIPGKTTILANQIFNNSSRSNSWLLGGLGGLNTNWIFFNFLRLYANFSAALMYQDFKIHNEQYITVNNSSVLNYFSNYQMKTLTPNIDTNIGIAWGGYFFQKRIHLDVSVGYDFSLFWNQNAIKYLVGDIIKNKDNGTLNNLYLHGINGYIRLDF